ncbi:MAG: HlyD family secretion protein [Chitinophagales bacterium]
MLNISNNTIEERLKLKEFKSFKLLKKNRIEHLPLYLAIFILLAFIASLFLPWTQNIQSKGYVTTKLPSQKPQAIQSVIAGKIEEWFVIEGDFVEAGDTIVFLSEIKNDYFDPNLVAQTTTQMKAKSQSIEQYKSKVAALETQYEALQAMKKLKIEQTKNKIIQTKNKIKIDSIDLQAYRTNSKFAQNQWQRTKELYEKNLKTLTDVQDKEAKWQQMKAKTMAQENKWLNQKNELLNLRIELAAIDNEYADKLAKSKSDKYSAVSNKLEAVAQTSKLENQLSNYETRQKMYYVTASQAGYITKTIKKGIGEIIKEGTDIVTIMPSEYELAVEMYVKPQDVPLLNIGNTVKLRFDGWPAMVISGWPEASTGVFSGKVMAIDRIIGENGYYRLLVIGDKTQKTWPEHLRIGTGVNAFLLLNNVPIWYELWRQLNGFPPDFYEKSEGKKQKIKRKAPIKSVK